METIRTGRATNKGVDGADYWIMHLNQLPDYYISKHEAELLGWVPRSRNLHIVAPGKKMIFGGIFDNDEGKQPCAPGRIWYEADINFLSGRRNSERLLFSSDGLIFVTYDHYTTFQEIV